MIMIKGRYPGPKPARGFTPPVPWQGVQIHPSRKDCLFRLNYVAPGSIRRPVSRLGWLEGNHGGGTGGHTAEGGNSAPEAQGDWHAATPSTRAPCSTGDLAVGRVPLYSGT